MAIKKIKKTLLEFDNRFLRAHTYLLKNTTYKQRKKIRKLSKNPIILGGSGRSGTTLLLSILSAHPNIYSIHEETNAFCPTGYETNPNLKAHFSLSKVYVEIINEIDNIKENRWWEKTPKNIIFAKQILDYLGENARFINIVRDGRDVITSMHKENENNYWVPIERWIYDIKKGIEVESHPQVLTVRYEDLITNFKMTISKIMNFVDEKYHPNFDLYPQTSNIKSHRAWNKSKKTIFSDSIGKWRKDEHKKIIEQFYSNVQALRLLEYYKYI